MFRDTPVATAHKWPQQSLSESLQSPSKAMERMRPFHVGSQFICAAASGADEPSMRHSQWLLQPIADLRASPAHWLTWRQLDCTYPNPLCPHAAEISPMRTTSVSRCPTSRAYARHPFANIKQIILSFHPGWLHPSPRGSGLLLTRQRNTTTAA